MNQRNHKFASKILFLILIFICTDIIFENFIVVVNDTQSPFISTFLLFAFLILQILFSPIQAGFSDLGRKKGLIISLSISLISWFLIFLYVNNITPVLVVLFISTSLKGMWGNTLPISWGAIADTQTENYRGSYALASGAYAVSYLALIALHNYSISENISMYSLGTFIIISLLLACFVFRDPEDLTVEKDIAIEKIKKSSKGIIKYLFVFLVILKKEKLKAFNNIRDRPTRQALLAYLLWSISMYSILISQIDLHHNPRVPNSDFPNNIATAMMFGYLTGVIILKMKIVTPIRDSIIIKYGYIISLISLLPYFVLFPFVANASFLLGTCYYLHAFGNSFLSPAFLSFLSKEKPLHEKGLILGLVESSDTMAFMLSVMAVMLYNYLELPLIALIGFSFGSFVLSCVFYDRFKFDRTNNLG